MDDSAIPRKRKRNGAGEEDNVVMVGNNEISIDNNDFSKDLIKAFSEFLPPDFKFPLCLCCVPEHVDVGDETRSNACQAVDEINNQRYLCVQSAKNGAIVRPHVRIPFMSVCEGHRRRLYYHQCCATCGIFCVQGKFNVCNETERLHLFHTGCQRLDGCCPHCGSMRFAEETINLTVDMKHIQRNARMGPYQINPIATEFMIVQERNEYDKRRVGIPNTSFEINTVHLADEGHRISIREAVALAEKRLSSGLIFDAAKFSEAVKGNELANVICCLASGISADCPLKHSLNSGSQYLLPKVSTCNALHIAAIFDYPLLAFVLIQVGININFVDYRGRNGLMYAAAEKNGRYNIASMLLKAGIDLSTQDENGETALHIAASRNNAFVVGKILSKCCKKDFYNDNNEDHGFGACAQLMNTKNNSGKTALMLAVENGYAEIINRLLHFGGKIEDVDNNGNTCLHLAALSNNSAVIPILLNDNVAIELIDKQNNQGDTALIVACQRRFYTFVEQLFRLDANPNLKNANDFTAVDFCKEPNDGELDCYIQLQLAFTPKQTANGLPNQGRVIASDLSKGRERVPVPVVNDIDLENAPFDFRYFRSLFDADEKLFVQRISPAQERCTCSEDAECSSEICVCSHKLTRETISYDKDGLLLKPFDLTVSTRQPEIYECSEICSCNLSTCLNRVAQKGMTVRLEVRKTHTKGWGVFAAEDIASGSFVCEYAGELLPDDQAERREEDSYLFDLDVGLKHVATFCIDAKHVGNVARFINHSCAPNVWPVRVFWDHHDPRAPHICFFAIKEIKMNEEICFDYGGKFWMIKGQHFSCVCGTEGCKYNAEKIKDFVESCQNSEKHFDA